MLHLLKINESTPAPYLVSQFLLFWIGSKCQVTCQQSIHCCLSEIPVVPAQQKLENSIKQNSSSFSEHKTYSTQNKTLYGISL